jgi:hypothetical protein
MLLVIESLQTPSLTVSGCRRRHYYGSDSECIGDGAVENEIHVEDLLPSRSMDHGTFNHMTCSHSLQSRAFPSPKKRPRQTWILTIRW